MVVLPKEGRDRLRHDAGEGEGDPDVQLSTCQVLQFLEPLQTVVGSMECLLGERQQFLPGFGECHLMAVSLKQGLLKVILQLQDLMG